MVGFLGTYGDVRGKVKCVMNMGLFDFSIQYREDASFEENTNYHVRAE